jgi:hypothetical protein
MEETMTEIRNVGQEVQAEIMKTARRSHEVVVGAIRTWTETVHSIAPQLNLPLPRRLPPFADRLPRPEELAASAYDFAQKLLANQRKFAEDMLHAAAPVLPGLGSARKPGTASKAAPGEKPGTAPKAEAPSKAAAGNSVSTQKAGTPRKVNTGRRAATTRKAGPAGEENGSAAR